MYTRNYDVIVAGAGSMGAATAYQLARRGCRVLALEQFEQVPHENGSHGGQSRIIRKAYFEDPGYIPLLERAYHNWEELEDVCGETVYYPSGLLYGGPPNHAIIQGVKQSAFRYNIPLDPVPASAVPAGLQHQPDFEWWLEKDAGFLLPEKIIRLYLQEATRKQAFIQTGERILEWSKTKDGIRVVTNKETYYSRKLIITAGAWTAALLKENGLPLTITRQVILWTLPEDPQSFRYGQFPCWLVANNDHKGAWYGFPYLAGPQFPGPEGMKFARHFPGEETVPGRQNRVPGEAEWEELTREARQFFKPAGGKRVTAKTCLYSNTPDENFIIDLLPGYQGDVAIACGFSGHGFKFVSVVGEILADLVTKGKTEWPVGFLSMQRFS